MALSETDAIVAQCHIKLELEIPPGCSEMVNVHCC